MKLASAFVFVCFYSYALAHSGEERELNDVTVTESLSNDHSKFVNILLDKLEEKDILDESASSKLLATFRVKGVNREQGKAYTKANIKTLTVGGDADSARKFVSRLASVFGKNNHGQHLVEHLLELALDNDLLDAKHAAEMAGNNGYGVKIKVTRFRSTSTTEDVEGKPQAPAKPCCTKNLTPLFELRIDVGRDLYYFANERIFTYYMNTCGGCRRYINGAIARVASSADACGCDGQKLQPVYYVYKPFVHGSEHGHIYTTDLAEATRLNKAGYALADAAVDKAAYYCAKTQGQCGATAALRKYSYGHLYYFTIHAEEGAKRVAGGWKDEGILCYVWPMNHME